MTVEVKKPNFTLVTQGKVDVLCEPSVRPIPCSPNTGFCEPRILCRPQTEGAPCNPFKPLIPNCSPEFRNPCMPDAGPKFPGPS